MRDYKELVKGRIVTAGTSQPVQGAEVKVYDKDLLASDHLGTATTDGEGRFAVEFRWSDFKDTPFEDRPDIFLKVTNPASGKTTKTKVYEELTGELAQDDSVEVMDLGDVPVD
jgi:hypothetical protein